MIHQTLQPLWDDTIDQEYSQPAKLSDEFLSLFEKIESEPHPQTKRRQLGNI